MFSVWGRIEENEFANAVHTTVTTMFPDDPPQFLPRTPYSRHDMDRIRDTLREAWFAPTILAFLEEHPRIEFLLDLLDRYVDLFAEGRADHRDAGFNAEG